MPQFEEAELRALIDAGGVCAFSVDTNVFHRHGYNLEASALVALGQFTARGIAHVVTDIVVREVCLHAAEVIEKASSDLKNALRRYGKTRRERDEQAAAAVAGLGLDEHIAETVARRWDDFARQTSAEVLAASALVNADTLVSMYFNATPPFERSGEKKAEFPDAIALLELEKFGERAGRHVLAVSRDAGWAAFASEARWLIVLGDLPQALALFNRAAGAVADRVSVLLDTPESALFDQVISSLSNHVDDLRPEIDAESYMEITTEFAGAEIANPQEIRFGRPAVIESDDDTVTLAIDAAIPVLVRADFAFYVHDSIDDDYLGMGSNEEERSINMTVPLTLVVSRGVDEDAGAREIRIEQLKPQAVEFGYVEPSGWRDEDN